MSETVRRLRDYLLLLLVVLLFVLFCRGGEKYHLHYYSSRSHSALLEVIKCHVVLPVLITSSALDSIGAREALKRNCQHECDRLRYLAKS